MIRLLKIQAQGLYLPLPIPVITLEHFPTGDRCPDYRCLSYTWGSPDPRQQVLINERRFEIGPNLFDFLQIFSAHYLSECEDYIWIDQLCIDQSNVAERTQQVSMMNTIYSEAKEVAVWLGPSANGSDSVMKAIRGCSELGGIGGRFGLMSRGLKLKIHHKKLDALLRRPYWDRLWIVQEIVLAKALGIYCGDSRCSAADFERIVSGIRQYGYGDSKGRFQNAHPLTTRWRGTITRGSVNEPSMDLSYAIATFASQQCYDPRDKIFGLAGMMKPGEQLPIDYSWTVEEVFAAACARLADRLLQGTGSNFGTLFALEVLGKEAGKIAEQRETMRKLAGHIQRVRHFDKSLDTWDPSPEVREQVKELLDAVQDELPE
ncbi:hypothetical protein EKO27_g4385 [Xylaria grammica]|uniref:Heterokaryon incompatibility domain-containing protein n=1 Tax=Xylaria grammica TaxID=363999 RepID=A0A439D8H9_9PEZI|nr:hypothetical protein EKO27_g4385 [Xylaria grammica]